MPDNATTCTLNTFGTFSTPTFAGVGEPYDNKLGAARPPPLASSASQTNHSLSAAV